MLTGWAGICFKIQSFMGGKLYDVSCPFLHSEKLRYATLGKLFRKGGEAMLFAEGVKVALFVMLLVFVLLGSIYGLIKLASAVIKHYFSNNAKG